MTCLKWNARSVGLAALLVVAALAACNSGDSSEGETSNGNSGAGGSTAGASGTAGQAGSTGEAGNAGANTAGNGGSAGDSGAGGEAGAGTSGHAGDAGSAGVGQGGDAGDGGSAAGDAGAAGAGEGGTAGDGGAAGDGSAGHNDAGAGGTGNEQCGYLDLDIYLVSCAGNYEYLRRWTKTAGDEANCPDYYTIDGKTFATKEEALASLTCDADCLRAPFQEVLLVYCGKKTGYTRYTSNDPNCKHPDLYETPDGIYTSVEAWQEANPCPP